MMPGTQTVLSRIEFKGDHIRSVLYDRRTAQETREFLAAVAAAAQEHHAAASWSW